MRLLTYFKLVLGWSLANSLLIVGITPVETHAQILRFREVEIGKVFRGSQPENAEDFRFLQGIKIRTIINLRKSEDMIDWEEQMAHQFNIGMINRPTSALLGPKPFEIDEIQGLLNDPRLQPIFIHCRHGKDRTGLMIGVYRVETQKWTPQAAYQEMRDLGFNPWLLALERAFWSRSPEAQWGVTRSWNPDLH